MKNCIQCGIEIDRHHRDLDTYCDCCLSMLGSIMTPWFKHWHEQEANALWRARMIESRIAIEWIRIAPQEMDRALARIAKCTQLKLVRVPKLEGEPSVIDLGEILTEDSDG